MGASLRFLHPSRLGSHHVGDGGRQAQPVGFDQLGKDAFGIAGEPAVQALAGDVPQSRIRALAPAYVASLSH
ncbi:hypothetical protein ACWFR5_44325 [Streptomyces sp. NPDC055092]